MVAYGDLPVGPRPERRPSLEKSENANDAPKAPTVSAQGAVWARAGVRALIVLTAGIMALGFLGLRAALLVAGLTALTYVLLWARGRGLPPVEEGAGRTGGHRW